jgi:acyl-[acyl-carrier-protein]-phospholipid O-acyltransferase/long-chain-fatty-acid--[acyl-carrier-protein] ligase
MEFTVLTVAAAFAAGVADALAGWLAKLWTRLCFRVRLVGRENLPTSGPVLIVFNHVSLVDRNAVMSVLPRDAWFYSSSPLKWLPIFADACRALRSNEPEGRLLRDQADRIADERFHNGSAVCMFPEGRMTRLGHMTAFEPEFREFLDRRPDLVVVPGYIHGTWHSVFSFCRGKFLWKRPRLRRTPVVVSLGEPIPASTPNWRIRQSVQLAATEAFEAVRYERLPVHRLFIYNAKRYARRRCFADSNTPATTYGATLMRAVILKRLLARKLKDGKYVGVFVPPSVGGVMANIALTLHGRVPVNLNYTIGQDSLDSCIRQAGIEQVVTSKAFLSKIPLKPSAELIILEDLRKDLRSSDKLVGLAARILPAWFVDRVLLGLGGHSIDDVATIVFSSGSTGEPKGVVLTHHNIVSNAEQTIQHTDATENDFVLGILPLFHSFGYTVTMWVPIVLGAGCVYHFNPLEAETIGGLSREHRPTLFFATSTFLRNYIRKCHSDDFRSLRMLVCGAEKLQPGVAADFAAKFGIYPSEGYGCTELSPVVSTDRPNYVQGAVRQIGDKRGSIGHPLPGIAAGVRDVETKEPLPLGSEGLLFIKGPNVMAGYLNKPEMTAEAIQDGWYNTGDIARLDEDGFIWITDRLARFSKIGGEMVPHAKIEDEMHKILGASDPSVCVVGAPDRRRGERLVVVHTALPISVAELWQKLRDSGVPGIWLPAQSDFHQVDALPILGTGKLDLKAVKRMAREMSERREASGE